MPQTAVDWDSAVYETPPDRVFRFFKDPEHANALAAGNVWLSTLGACREYEDPFQGDSGEAEHTYHSGTWKGNGTDPNIQLVAQRSGIRVEGNVVLSDNVCVTRISDGFVICATEFSDPGEFSETFGEFCVEIEDPKAFFQAVHRAFPQHSSMTRGVFGRVQYRERSYKGVGDAPGLIGFVKPKKYDYQREMRFLWYTSGQRLIKPFLLSVPDAAHFCKRIS